MASGKTAEQRRLMVLLTLLAVVAVIGVYQLIGSGSLSPGEAGIESLNYEPHQLPQLAQVEVVRGNGDELGTGRNPFLFGVRPTPTRAPTTPRPTQPPRTPRPPRATPTPRLIRGDGGKLLPPPPPFDRQFIGFFGPPRLKVAAFRRALGDNEVDIDIGVEGEVLDDTFIVRQIGLESVTIGFVGYPESEDTRVPLVEN